MGGGVTVGFRPHQQAHGKPGGVRAPAGSSPPPPQQVAPLVLGQHGFSVTDGEPTVSLRILSAPQGPAAPCRCAVSLSTDTASGGKESPPYSALCSSCSPCPPNPAFCAFSSALELWFVTVRFRDYLKEVRARPHAGLCGAPRGHHCPARVPAALRHRAGHWCVEGSVC